MENTGKKREWVKNAAIIFLVILLILTFFSNTIMNIALPEVTTEMVNSGSITAKVRGTGTVTANGSYSVTAEQTRELRTVPVRVGQQVNAGDVLFVLGAGASEELEAAQETLHNLELSYQRTALSFVDHDFYSEQTAYQDALKALDTAERAVKDAEDEMIAATNLTPETVAEAKDNYEAAQQKIDEINVRIEAYDTAAAEALAAESAAISARAELEAAAKDTEAENYEQKLGEAQKAAEEAEAALTAAQAKRDAIVLPNSTEIVDAENKLIQTKSEYDRLWEILKTKGGNSVTAYNEATAAYAAAEREVEYRSRLLEQAQASASKSDALGSIELNELSKQIEKQKELIAELSGGVENEVLAPVAGTVQEIYYAPGTKVPAGDTMCIIEVSDMGYSVSFSVTSEQARRLHTGDKATVSNYYWGREVIATLTTIAADPKNPQGSKILTFSLEGEVSAGNELTISVGQKSANYDLVVPNSAVRKDSNGEYVLAIEAKNSPLGNRYFAKRVKVEVVASDDINSAVVGDLSTWSDYVITTGSAPVSAGDQVRMAES